MPKNSKNQESNGATDSSAAEDLTEPKKRSKSSTKTSKAAAKKSTARSGAKKTSPPKSARKKRGDHEPSDDEIRLRAYFIAERRVQLSLEGDPANDWLEARKQLLEEADQRKAAAAPASE